MPAVSESLRELRHGIVPYPPFQKADVPVKVAAPIKDFQTDTTDAEDWIFPPLQHPPGGPPRHGPARRLRLLRHAAGGGGRQADRGGMVQPDTVLYAASAGSPFLLGHHLERMRKHGVMRCPPLGSSRPSPARSFQPRLAVQDQGRLDRLLLGLRLVGARARFCLRRDRARRQTRMFVIGAGGRQRREHPALRRHARAVAADRPLARLAALRRGPDGFVGTGGATSWSWRRGGGQRRGAKSTARSPAGPGFRRLQCRHLAPEGNGLRLAIANALKYSDTTAEQVDYVNAHATSTPSATSPKPAPSGHFGHSPTRPAVSSTKALTATASRSPAPWRPASAPRHPRGFMPGSAHITRLDPACEG